MPYASEAQRAMFHARAKTSQKWAKMASEWDSHTPQGAKLPKRATHKRRRGGRRSGRQYSRSE